MIFRKNVPICKKGKISMSINDVLTDKDLKEGWILTCTGFPREDNTEIVFPDGQK